MELNGVNEKKSIFLENDVYFMETLADFIVINFDYNGIKFFDFELNLIEQIKWKKEVMIYSSFTYKNELLLFCPDNECLIYIYIEKDRFTYQFIELKDFGKYIFTELYEWKEDNVLLFTYQGEILCVDLKKGNVRHLNDQLENKKTLSLKQYISKLSDFNILKVCSQQHVAVIQKEKTKIEFVDYREKIKVLMRLEKGAYHDWETKEGYLVAIGEKKLLVCHDGGKKEYFPEENTVFLRGKFAKKNGKLYFFLLIGDKSDCQKTCITKYSCEK